MFITISKSTGKAKTNLGAFDNALFNAGIANYNLIYLSSVIPPNSEVIEVASDGHKVAGVWGDRLYVVMAQQREDRVGHQAWAGIGWVQDPETKKGLFVEHEGSSKEGVETDIRNSLNSLLETRGISNFGDIQIVTSGIECTEDPICAMVAAVFESESWKM